MACSDQASTSWMKTYILCTVVLICNTTALALYFTHYRYYQYIKLHLFPTFVFTFHDVSGLLGTVPTSQSQTSNTLNPGLVQKDFQKSPSSQTKWGTLPDDVINGYSLVICDEDFKTGIESYCYKSQNKEDYE